MYRERADTLRSFLLGRQGGGAYCPASERPGRDGGGERSAVGASGAAGSENASGSGGGGGSVPGVVAGFDGTRPPTLHTRAPGVRVSVPLRAAATGIDGSIASAGARRPRNWDGPGAPGAAGGSVGEHDGSGRGGGVVKRGRGGGPTGQRIRTTLPIRTERGRHRRPPEPRLDQHGAIALGWAGQGRGTICGAGAPIPPLLPVEDARRGARASAVRVAKGRAPRGLGGGLSFTRTYACSATSAAGGAGSGDVGRRRPRAAVKGRFDSGDVGS